MVHAYTFSLVLVHDSILLINEDKQKYFASFPGDNLWIYLTLGSKVRHQRFKCTACCLIIAATTLRQSRSTLQMLHSFATASMVPPRMFIIDLYFPNSTERRLVSERRWRTHTPMFV